MGVRGLCTFIDRNPRLTETYDLHDTKVIIDGSNMAHFLYKNLDFLFGGEYGKYADEVKKFFSALIRCNIEPIVVFYGGWDMKDRLYHNKAASQRRRLKNAIDSVGCCNESVTSNLPINTYEVCKDVLLELGIRLVQCDYEGDNQMAALANDLKCPLLSNDSDFYIFDIKHGFIRLPHLDTRVREIYGWRKNKIKHLKCQIYFRDSLLQFHRLRDGDHLHLYAVLLGNDYNLNESFESFFSKIGVNTQTIHRDILNWLRGHRFQENMNIIMDKADERMRAKIEDCIEHYRLKPTHLKCMLESKSDDILASTNIKTLCGAELPREFVIAFHKGLISSSVLNVISLHRRLLQPQAENFSKESSYCCSRYIRQVTYGILLQHDCKDEKMHAETCLRSIVEYDRVKKQIEEVRVPYLTQLTNGNPIPKLSEVYGMQQRELRHFLADLLEIQSNSFFEAIPTDLKLIFGCLVFWLRNCNPKPTQNILDAILTRIVVQRASKTTPQSVGGYSTKKPMLDEKIMKYTKVPALDAKNLMDHQVLHFLSQLQACIIDISLLNSLLGLPFQTPKLQDTFSGHFLYNLSKELEFQSVAEAFIDTLLVDLMPTFTQYKEKICSNCF